MTRRDLKRFRRLVRREARELQAIYDVVPSSVDVGLPGVLRTKIKRGGAT